MPAPHFEDAIVRRDVENLDRPTQPGECSARHGRIMAGPCDRRSALAAFLDVADGQPDQSSGRAQHATITEEELNDLADAATVVPGAPFESRPRRAPPPKRLNTADVARVLTRRLHREAIVRTRSVRSGKESGKPGGFPGAQCRPRADAPLPASVSAFYRLRMEALGERDVHRALDVVATAASDRTQSGLRHRDCRCDSRGDPGRCGSVCRVAFRGPHVVSESDSGRARSTQP